MKAVFVLLVLVLWVLGCLFGGWLISFFFPVVPFILGVKISALVSLVNSLFSLLSKIWSKE